MKYNIKINLKQEFYKDVDWKYLAQGSVQRMRSLKLSIITRGRTLLWTAEPLLASVKLWYMELAFHCQFNNYDETIFCHWHRILAGFCTFKTDCRYPAWTEPFPQNMLQSVFIKPFTNLPLTKVGSQSSKFLTDTVITWLICWGSSPGGAQLYVKLTDDMTQSQLVNSVTRSILLESPKRDSIIEDVVVGKKPRGCSSIAWNEAFSPLWVPSVVFKLVQRYL